MVKRFLISVALLIPVAIIAQIDWTKQVKNVPSYVVNALGDPGAAGFVKRTTANTSTVAGGSDVWPGTIPLTAVSGTTGAWPGTIPFASVTGTTVAWPGTIPFASVSGTTVAWPGTLPFTSLTATPNLLRDPGANGVVYRNALNTTAAATGANLPTMVASGASHSAGAAPDPGAVAGTSHYLREDASWSVPAVSAQSVNLANLNGGTGTRLINTTGSANIYQNTTGRPMMVTISFLASNAASWLSIRTDSNATPVALVAEAGVPNSAPCWFTLTAWVLPNNYYTAYSGGAVAATIEYWVEWN